MNIGFDAKRAFFNKSGLGNYSRSTISLLEQFYKENNYFLYSNKHNIDLFDITEKNLILRDRRNCASTLPNTIWRSYGITKCIKNDNLDIYHGLSNELPLNIKSAENVKKVVTIHDLIFLKFPELYNSIDRRIYNFKFRKSTQLADIIIAVSQQTKNDIIEYYKIDEKKIKVVYQTCSDLFKEKYSDNDKNEVKQKYNLPQNFILYVGTIEQRKKLLNIIKAIHEYNIDIPIIAVGKKTKYMNQIDEYLIRNNIQNKLEILNNVNNIDLATIYQIADLFVYPSIYEGFGIPIIEALYSEIPVITSLGGCFSEAGGKSTIYVEPNNIEELANSIKKVLNDSSLRTKMINDGIVHSKKFDNQIVAENFMNVYKSVL